MNLASEDKRCQALFLDHQGSGRILPPPNWQKAPSHSDVRASRSKEAPQPIIQLAQRTASRMGSTHEQEGAPKNRAPFPRVNKPSVESFKSNQVRVRRVSTGFCHLPGVEKVQKAASKKGIDLRCKRTTTKLRFAVSGYDFCN